MSDARDVQRLAGDHAIADTTLTIPHPYEDGMAEEWIATHRPRFEAGELVNFAIALQATAELVGAIGLHIERRSDKAELGYWVGRPFWRRGYCTEAARAVIDYGFLRLRLNRIHAMHFLRNPSSARVMQNLGMIREGVLRQYAKKEHKYEDVVLYRILREEWEQANT